jgi:NAD(P)-dependent dehydrogenase (short-subunit alcohol dehydrogenase family)
MGTALEGKVAVVTGSGRGIGRAYAHALAAEGARVVVNDLRDKDESPADDVAREIREAGGEAVANHDSVAGFQGAKSIMDTAVASFGGLDILICNAGIIRPAFIIDATPNDWTDVIAVHATGTFNCIHHAAPLMIQRGGGTIITTGDIATDVWFPRIVSYRAAKAAILVLTQHAANELRDENINVNSVMPAATDTRMLKSFYTSLSDSKSSFATATQSHYDNDAAASGVLAAPDTQPPIGVFLCTDEGRRFSGFSFQMNARNIGVVTPHTEVEFVSPQGANWTLHDLNEQIPPLLEKKQSLIQL